MITPHKLFELAGIPIPYLLLIEGYKEATAEFSAISPDAPAKIAAYKDLVQRNQATGPERNIDYWRKQGWEAFVAFIDSKSGPTKTQLKRKKVVGQSITLREDDEWLIVIPLDKDASCFHGKNSDWCTTKYTQLQFEDYFYKREAVLVYCLNKASGRMWAVIVHKRAPPRPPIGQVIAGRDRVRDKLEILDQQNTTVSKVEFTQQTGLDASEIVKLASAQSNLTNQSISDYHDIKIRLGMLPKGVRDDELEQKIVKYRFGDLAATYVRGRRQSDDLIQKLAVASDNRVLKYIKNPSEAVQKHAVQSSGLAIQFVDNPSEELQKIAVHQAGIAINWIYHPTEEVQKLAVGKTEEAIKYIANPTPAVVALHNELWGNQ